MVGLMYQGVGPSVLKGFTELAEADKVGSVMNLNQHAVRRANVEDLDGLRILWVRTHLQVLDLEKRLTEFQLVVSSEGDLIGAVGLHIDQRQGRIHSEAFLRAEDAVEARPWLWERIQTLARNHGLIRLWTREKAAFWGEMGFAEPSVEALATLPQAFRDGQGRWLTLGLRDESAAAISVEKEFELFQQAQRASTEEMLARARQMKIVVISVVLLLALAAMMAAVLFMVRQSQPGRGPVRQGSAASWDLGATGEKGGVASAVGNDRRGDGEEGDGDLTVRLGPVGFGVEE
jgi:N-acetylglutamate synthase-like GNAT family acetyltransferase